jgi:hypothetical protein
LATAGVVAGAGLPGPVTNLEVLDVRQFDLVWVVCGKGLECLEDRTVTCASADVAI